MLSPRTVFITGCSRGIGLEFVKQFLNLPHPPELLFASCRDPVNATELNDLAKSSPSVHVVKLDVTNDEDIKAAFQFTKEKLGNIGLNLLINNGGKMTSDRQGLESTPQTREKLLSVFDTNLIGPILVVQQFLPLLKRAAEEKKDEPMGCNRAAVINVSSAVGSISNTTAASVYPYRTSKCALNMASKIMSIDFQPSGILVVAFHPGHVKTDMGGPNALITTQECVEKSFQTLSQIGEDGNGLLHRFDGRTMPW